MIRKFTVTRQVTPFECSWLSETHFPGDEVYEYNGCTYGCIDWDNGIAVSELPGETPFFQLPYDAIKEVV